MYKLTKIMGPLYVIEAGLYTWRSSNINTNWMLIIKIAFAGAL